MMQRGDIDTIVSWVPEGGKVLDLGCGDGELLHRLQAEKRVEGLGVDIDPANIIAAVGKGLCVVQQDMEDGLQNFEGSRFDAVIIAYSLQVLERPHAVLERIASIGNEAIVTFPNFGHWRSRLSLLLGGRMPQTKALPYSWFDSPNIHFCTVADFEALCKDLNVAVVERRMSSGVGLLAELWPNLFAKSASYRITRR
jgi:methionine biosynthesis protein MetW